MPIYGRQSEQFTSRFWFEGEVTQGNPLAPQTSSAVVFNGFWDQRPPAFGDQVTFNNIFLNPGRYTLRMLGVGSTSTGSATITINGLNAATFDTERTSTQQIILIQPNVLILDSRNTMVSTVNINNDPNFFFPMIYFSFTRTS